MSKEKQRELEEINRPMNEEAFNNLEKKYQELAKVKAESEQIEEMLSIINNSDPHYECKGVRCRDCEFFFAKKNCLDAASQSSERRCVI